MVCNGSLEVGARTHNENAPMAVIGGAHPARGADEERRRDRFVAMGTAAVDEPRTAKT